MADSLTDIAIDGDGDIYLTDTNDLATVSGFDDVQQSIAINTRNVTNEMVGGPLTPRLINKLRGQVRDTLDADPQVGTVHAVEIQEVRPQDNTVEIFVRLSENDDFTVTLP